MNPQQRGTTQECKRNRIKLRGIKEDQAACPECNEVAYLLNYVNHDNIIVDIISILFYYL